MTELAARQERPDHAEVCHEPDARPRIASRQVLDAAPHARADLASALAASGPKVRLARLESKRIGRCATHATSSAGAVGR